ncbi:MAG: AMP-dependent synthetase/ligase [Anaerovoracaceae bacterium]
MAKKARNKMDYYETREVSDIKDMIYSSVELYADRRAFLVKNKPGDQYRPISYTQLREDMDGLGTGLMELGLQGKKIAVIGENRYEWVITYLAVVCGGSVIVPLDRELPHTEIRNLLERAGASALVFSGKVSITVDEAIKDLEGLEYLIGMDMDEDRDGKKSLKRLIARGKTLIDMGNRKYIEKTIDPEAMNMLLYTSGTTGLAKGVMLSHKNIISNVINMSKYVNVDGMVGLSVLPMSHTYEMTCHIMTSMYQGVCVAICDGLKYIVQNMVEAKVNVMLGVPLIFESMHKKVWKQAEKSGKAVKMRKAIAVTKKLGIGNTGATRRIFKQVHQTLGGEMKLLISGAAAIDPEVVENFCAMGFNMIQGYGMTECSPIIAVNKDNYSKAASVGLPLPGTEILIQDPDENGIGEIVCKSASVMIGYYDDPEETDRVLKDGWLYTGDYGYMDKDGFLYITGRKKNVIVTKNGKNIFPEEVEYYMARSDYIGEIMVYGMEDKKNGETIVCAEIFPDHPAIEEVWGVLPQEEIRKLIKREIDKLNDLMPLYKRVKRFEIRETEFEKTTSKKIKRYMANHNSN